MNLRARLESQIPPLYLQRLRELSRLAGRMGLEPYLVGGVARDLLLKAPFRNDCDVVFTGGSIAGLAAKLAKRWRLDHRSYPAFETHTLRSPSGFHMDLITARSETYSEPAALPSVRRGGLKDDLHRRDFTVNAMAVNLSEKGWGELVDLNRGLDDLRKKKIRILHRDSFSDDPTRLFRAARYAGRFGFALETYTLKGVKDAVRKKMARRLSADRIRNEIEKILCESSPGEALALLQRWGVLKDACPALPWDPAIAGWMREKSDARGDKDAAVARRMALWLARAPRSDAESILEALNFTRALRERIRQPLDWIEAFRNRAPVETIAVQTVFPESVRVLDALARGRDPLKLAAPWRAFKKWESAKPVLDGGDLRKMGIPPGPLYKEILSRLRLKKYRGELASRRDEIRFVFDNYRRN